MKPDARIWLFRIIALTSIVFAAGHSGGFLNTQEGYLARYGWGLFGALVAGLALWGGIYIYAAYGQKSGLVVAFIAGMADAVMGYGWFLASGSIAPLVLALWPPLLALLAGLIEGVLTKNNRMRAEERQAQDDSFARSLEIERIKQGYRIERAKLRQAEPPRVVVGAAAAVRGPRRDPVGIMIGEIERSEGRVTITELADLSGMSRGWVCGALKKAGYRKEGDAWSRSS